MRLALEQAQKAATHSEVPVGAIITLKDEVIGTGYNQNRTLNDPSAHAEIQALRMAAKHVGNYRLNHATLFVTLEPCIMCAGALLHARIETLVYGTRDERWGAAGSVANVLDSPLMNHSCQVIGGILEQDAATLIQRFFLTKRS